MTWSSVLLGTLTGLLLFYALLLGLLWRSSRRTGNSDLLREALRLLPDLLRLLKNLADSNARAAEHLCPPAGVYQSI